MNPTEIRNLERYLNEERKGASGFSPALLALLRFILVVALPVAIISYMIFNFHWWFFLFIGAGPGIYGKFARNMERKAKDAAWSLPGVSSEAKAATSEVRELATRGTLSKRIHPEIGRRLDACAKAAMDIRQMLQSESWVERSKTGHWKEVSKNAMVSVDESVHEAIVASMPFIRRSGMRKADFEAMVATGTGYEHAAAELDAWTAKLQELRSGLEQAGGERSESRIDRTLRELGDLRAAEAELDESRQTA